jgi:hypothetical protein
MDHVAEEIGLLTPSAIQKIQILGTHWDLRGFAIKMHRKILSKIENEAQLPFGRYLRQSVYATRAQHDALAFLRATFRGGRRVLEKRACPNVGPPIQAC